MVLLLTTLCDAVLPWQEYAKNEFPDEFSSATEEDSECGRQYYLSDDYEDQMTDYVENGLVVENLQPEKPLDPMWDELPPYRGDTTEDSEED